MALALALLSHRSLGFALYAGMLNGISVAELAAQFKISVYEIHERIEATQLTFTRQVVLEINPHAGTFRTLRDSVIAA